MSKKKSCRVELKEIRDNLQVLIEWPDENYLHRTDDGYPAEFDYDRFAYQRMVDTYRNAIKSILDTQDEK